MRMDYLKEFRDKYYINDRRVFLNRTLKNLEDRVEDIIPQVEQNLEALFSEVTRFQERLILKTGWIQISLLLSSVYLKKPQLFLGAYDENGVLGGCICSRTMDASWLFPYWEEFEETMTGHCRDMGAHPYIRKEQIRILMWETLDYLIKSLAVYLKYPLAFCDMLGGYRTMEKTDTFYVMAGAYMDWQRTLFKQEKEVDIFFNPEEKPLQFQKYHNKRFYRKAFKDMDLRHCRFTDCRFLQCSFENADLSDTVFDSCALEHITTRDVKMYGITIMNSGFRDVDFTGADLINTEEFPREIYKKAEFLNCESDQELPKV